MIIVVNQRRIINIVLAPNEVWREHFKLIFPRGGRTIQVLQFMMQGKTTGEIGKILGISPKTVSVYKFRLHDVLHSKSEAELGVYAHYHKLVTLEEVKG